MNKLVKFSFAALFLAASFSFSACSKKDDPTPEIEMEEPDEMIITFTKLDANGNETQEKKTLEFELAEHNHDHASLAATDTHEGHDHAAPHIHLDVNSKYRMSVQMLRDQKDINAEFLQAGHVHQFFYTPKDANGKVVSGFVKYSYEDKDSNQRNIGLKGTLEVLTEGENDIQVLLSHGLDKSRVAQDIWMYPGLSAIGGDTDMDQSFELHVEAH